ncbi:MAG: hypothetical protein IVW51_06180 [Thermaceae bacterium]|nr:hypothetical protein [Thermaceae bacterium]
MPEALVRVYKLFAFDVPVEDVEDPYDAIPIAKEILNSFSLTEALDKFDGEEIFDNGEESTVTHFDGKDLEASDSE